MDVEIKMDQLTFDLAHQVAVNELIRAILIEMASGDGGSAFRNRLRRIEEGVVDNLNRRPHFPGIPFGGRSRHSGSRVRLRYAADRNDLDAGPSDAMTGVREQ